MDVFGVSMKERGDEDEKEVAVAMANAVIIAVVLLLNTSAKRR